MASCLCSSTAGVALACLLVVGVRLQGDATAGRDQFEQKCASCHTVTSDLAHGLLGPNLVGVVGRTAGTASGWEFSNALKNSKLTWTEENLSKWLTDSTAFVAGAQMDLKVPSRIEREDLIAYLKTLEAKK